VPQERAKVMHLAIHIDSVQVKIVRHITQIGQQRGSHQPSPPYTDPALDILHTRPDSSRSVAGSVCGDAAISKTVGVAYRLQYSRTAWDAPRPQGAQHRTCRRPPAITCTVPPPAANHRCSEAAYLLSLVKTSATCGVAPQLVLSEVHCRGDLTALAANYDSFRPAPAE
jgi:hypothetical protein